MTRKEEIINAARTYNDSVTLASPSNVIHFEAGAKWADEHPKNVWHDANEKPEGNNFDIMCQNKKGEWWVECKADAMRLPVTWDEYIEIEMIDKWAYVKDLLPKGGEK